MGVSCDCFGYASASKRPVKRYNLLVPDVFPKTEPAIDQPVDAATQRQFKRLYEYLQKNPARTPKVSRRLARNLNKDLRARRFGYVNLIGQALTYLLQKLPGQDSSLLAKELVCQHVDWDPAKRGHRRDFDAPQFHSVVGTLLLHSLAELRTTGVQALHQFIVVQTSSAYMEQIQEFVPLVCQSAGRSPHGVKDAKGTPPGAASMAALNAASLRCLQAYLQLCMRVVVISPYLQQIEKSILDMLQPGDDLPVSTTQGGKAPAAAPGGIVRSESGASSSAASHSAPAGAIAADDPATAANDAWLQLALVAKDVLEGGKVLDFLLAYLDQKGSWTSGDGMLDATLGSLRKAGGDPHQRYLLLCALLKHNGSAELAEGARPAVLQQAVLEANSLEPLVAFPALVFALQELPQRQNQPAAAAAQNSGMSQLPAGQPDTGSLAVAVVKALARRTTDASHVAEAVGGVCASLPPERDAGCSTVQLCISAASAAASCHQERGRASVAMPQLLLQDVAQQQLQGSSMRLRGLMLGLLSELLPLALPQGLREAQALAILSACWHQSQAMHLAESTNERQSLCQLLTAVAKHCSPSALPHSLRIAYSYHTQASSPEGIPHVADSAPQSASSTFKPAGHKLANGDKPGIVGTAVHAVGSMLHSALGSGTSPAASPQSASAQHKVTANSVPQPLDNGNTAESPAADLILSGGRELSNGDAPPASTSEGGSSLPASADGSGEQAVLHRRLRAVRFHDAALAGVAERLKELAPEHSFAAVLPAVEQAGGGQQGPEQLTSWLSHPAFRSRSSWQQLWEPALGAVLGSSKHVRSSLQEPFRPLPVSALLPKAKVRASRDDASRGSGAPRSTNAALCQQLLRKSSSSAGQQQASAASTTNKLPSVQELLQAPSAGTEQLTSGSRAAANTPSSMQEQVTADDLLSALDELDSEVSGGKTASKGDLAPPHALHLSQLLQAMS